MGDDRFREMFFEEARELLLGLEEGLMELERRAGDRAHLDRTFRAAHSIKGAAGMVGLAEIAGFTHLIEGVLDRVRAGSLAVDSYLIGTLLEARDHLAAAVEAEAVSAPIPAPPDLVQRLDGLFRDLPVPATPPPVPAPAPVPPPALSTKRRGKAEPKGGAEAKAKPSRAKKPGSPKDAPPSPAAASPAHPAGPGGLNHYFITLNPGAEILKRGSTPSGSWTNCATWARRPSRPTPGWCPRWMRWTRNAAT